MAISVGRVAINCHRGAESMKEGEGGREGGGTATFTDSTSQRTIMINANVYRRRHDGSLKLEKNESV